MSLVIAHEIVRFSGFEIMKLLELEFFSLRTLNFTISQSQSLKISRFHELSHDEICSVKQAPGHQNKYVWWDIIHIIYATEPGRFVFQKK